MTRSNLLQGAAIVVLALAPAVAFAGPCASDIAQLGKQLGQSSSLGPVTTGALSGSNPDNAGKNAPQKQADMAGTTGSSSGRIGGTAGTKELNAASTQLATSPEDVRRQQEGQPTMAAQAQAGAATGGQPGSQSKRASVETNPQGVGSAESGNMSANFDSDKVSRAKADWQQAVDLDAKGDTSCMDAVKQAQQSLQGS